MQRNKKRRKKTERGIIKWYTNGRCNEMKKEIKRSKKERQTMNQTKQQEEDAKK